MGNIISAIHARQIIDSRGNPTVEADIWVDGNFAGRAAVPSGASTGSHEAHELRDMSSDYHGKSVHSAISNVHDIIAPALISLPVDNQQQIDATMLEIDGTPNKSKLGANAILAVSLSVAHAAANRSGQLLYAYIASIFNSGKPSIPRPMFNLLNGGKHAPGSSDIQEYMVIPTVADSYARAVQVGCEIFQSLKSIIHERGLSTAVGDEGGFTYPVKSNRDMLDALVEASIKSGYQPGRDVHFALDIAATEFHKDNLYNLAVDSQVLTSAQCIDYIKQLTLDYPILSVEDGLGEDDWDGWVKLTHKLPKVQLVGDDLLVTNPSRLEQAIAKSAGNAILIKPNQIGTLTETLQTIKTAQDAGWKTVISHRSGETEDTTIAHLAIGTGAGQIKTGSVARGERTAKHNEIMRIEGLDPSLKLEP